ncbi:MAG: guanylate kinase [Opitutales bacterium]|nr:guanylate kinase [Opitutales bacterium]
MATEIPRKGIILLISGPAGSGKTTLCEKLIEEFDEIRRIVTATTRKPRKSETHGTDYYFLKESEFLKKMEEDAFYECARVHGRHYGTLKSEVHRQLESGYDVILNIDVQGAASFRKKAQADEFLADRLITVFIQPESLDVIRGRLLDRESDSNEEIERRLLSAKIEMEVADEFHYILPTSTREHDYRIISSIYLSEKHKVNL